MRPDVKASRGRTSGRIAGLAAVALTLGSCATFENGVIDDIPVVTIPAGASVSSSSGTICTSPCAVSGARKEDIGITITKTGYVTQFVTAASKPGATLEAAQSATWTPDVLGRFVDVQDGAHFKHVPSAFVVKLDPAPAP